MSAAWVDKLDNPGMPELGLASSDVYGDAEAPSGCVFHSRCPRRLGERCDREEPPLADIGDDHLIRCHLQPSQLGRAEQVDVAFWFPRVAQSGRLIDEDVGKVDWLVSSATPWTAPVNLRCLDGE